MRRRADGLVSRRPAPLTRSVSQRHDGEKVSVGVVSPIGWPIGHRMTSRVTSTLVQRAPENPVDHVTATGNNLRPEAAPTVLSSNNNVSLVTTTLRQLVTN